MTAGEVVGPPPNIPEPVRPPRNRPKPERYALTLDQVADLVAGVLRGTDGLRCVEIVRALESRVPYARARVPGALRGRPRLFVRDGAVWRVR